MTFWWRFGDIWHWPAFAIFQKGTKINYKIHSGPTMVIGQATRNTTEWLQKQVFVCHVAINLTERQMKVDQCFKKGQITTSTE
eukprot:4976425-Amphidinium_carterae.1